MVTRFAEPHCCPSCEMSITQIAAACAVSAALLGALVTRFLIRFSFRLRLMAQPRTDRWHRQPTPNTGGIAILVVGAAVLFPVFPARYSLILAAAVLVSLLGFLDDRIQLRPSIKLAGQSAAALAVLASGVVFRATPWEVLNFALSFFWIVGVTNAFNLIDNMDGLCAGVTVIISGFRCWFAFQNGDPACALIMAVLGGSFLGFLVFNYGPARIFMGDCGSMLAGFLLSALAIASPVPRTRVVLSALFYPALTFLYPIFDTLLVSVLRRAAGRPISVGGRDHSSHRLVSLGLSERRVVWLLWALTAIGSAAGLATYALPFSVVAVTSLMVVGATMFGVFLGTLPDYSLPESAPARSTMFRRVIPNLRACVTLLIDVLLAGVALLCAFLARWGDAFAGPILSQFLFSLPILMGGQALAALTFRSFNLGWRWFGFRDFLVAGKSVLAGSALSMFALWLLDVRTYSRGVLIIYVILACAFMVGLRLSLWFFWQTLGQNRGEHRRAAVLGADLAGELAILVLQRATEMRAHPVLILDSDPASQHTRVHGIPVCHAGADPAKVLKNFGVEVLVLPADSGQSPKNQHIVAACRAAHIQVERLHVSIQPLSAPARTALAGSNPEPQVSKPTEPCLVI